ILQFAEQGEKTGWTYIVITAAQANKLMPGNKKSFRVKGRLDEVPIKGIALLPMGEGDFIMALNAVLRKSLRKKKGDKLKVQLEADKKKIEPPADLLDCLADEPSALAYFKQLPKSHQNYFGNWIRSAKTDATRASRIARVVTAMAKKQNYGEMIRSARQDRLDQMG
ncbi:MAG TPA: YdeI/OmpD-associated family protein, partial [Puia sp.]|nr:YdeI/OmpD-associated family protein [Puia sp.]